MTTAAKEHPFAAYIRILGKGKRGSRSFTEEEAYRAMFMVLDGQVEPVQLGAFLMLMRVKEETPEELAGFVKAARDSIKAPTEKITVDLDWSSYAGKRRHLPWFILSALLLAENGIRIFMHGARGHTESRLYTEDMLNQMGIATAGHFEQSIAQLERHNFSFLALENFCPLLARIIDLRPILGLRSPVHTLARMLNPFNAEYSLQGIFHPGYRAVHQQASLLIKQPHVAVLKGEGGETERNPDTLCLVQSVHDGVLSDEQWPAMFKKRHLKPDTLKPVQLSALWNGEFEDEYALATVIGTAAIALHLLGKASSQYEAEMLAKNYWTNRDRTRLSPTKLNCKEN